MNTLLQRFLRSARIRTKLLAITLIPLSGLLYLSAIRSLERRNDARVAAELGQVTRLGVAMGNLLHELQRERGMTSGYITSQGKKFAPQLDRQRPETDRQLGELRTLLGSGEQGLSAGGSQAMVAEA